MDSFFLLCGLCGLRALGDFGCTLGDAKSDRDRYLLVYDPIWIDNDGVVHADGLTWTTQTITLPRRESEDASLKNREP